MPTSTSRTAAHVRPKAANEATNVTGISQSTGQSDLTSPACTREPLLSLYRLLLLGPGGIAGLPVVRRIYAFPRRDSDPCVEPRSRLRACLRCQSPRRCSSRPAVAAAPSQRLRQQPPRRQRRPSPRPPRLLRPQPPPVLRPQRRLARSQRPRQQLRPRP